MIDRVEAAGRRGGACSCATHESPRVGTIDAHRLLHAAGDQRGELKEALLHAYFVEAQNVADHDVLTRIATEVGLDEVAVKSVLTTDEYADEVEADIRQAAAYGATGVPFFVIDRQVRRLRRPAGRDVRAGARPRLVGQPTPRIEVIGGRRRLRPRRLRDLTSLDQTEG